MHAKPRKPYPSDLHDQEGARIEPLVPPPVPAAAPRTTDWPEVRNALCYLLTTGCAWSALPDDFPPAGTVRDYFHRGRRQGRWQEIPDTRRRRVRPAAGRQPEPSVGRIDSPAVKTSRTAGSRGYEAGKKNPRRPASPVGGYVGVSCGGGRACGQPARP